MNLIQFFAIFFVSYALANQSFLTKEQIGQQLLEIQSNSDYGQFGKNLVQTDDRKHNISQICEENGFKFQRYEVTTKDGYILSLDRVWMPGSENQKKPVILLQHGVEDSSIQWVINSPDKAFAFKLVKEGYDVWMGNNRGNIESRKHVSLNYKQEEFWEFDFEEMGTYDQPAIIDFILLQTKQTNTMEKIAAYVGHSEGTTQFFIGASLLPDYFEEKVALFVALAPIVRLDHSTNGLMVTAAQVYEVLEPTVKLTHMYDLIYFGQSASFLGSMVCKLLPDFCIKLMTGYSEWNDQIDNSDRWADKVAHSPAGAGWRCIAHYAQIIKRKSFQRWDYGKTKNQEKYGQDTPPEYDLSKIKVKMAFASGDEDELGNKEDIKWLIDKSQSGLNTDLLIFFKEYHFDHSSFTMSSDASYFDKDIIPLIDQQIDGKINEK